MATDHVASLHHLTELLRDLGHSAPGPMGGFARLHQASQADGALPRATKELMALAIAIALHCEGCIAYHLNDALQAGATRSEVIETIGVAVMMSGGPGTVYGTEALAALQQLEDAGVGERPAGGD
ncbi:MAG TPA: carboxymuconolactone decarboxylase family protein [Actinomycetota bacterium]|nr:carboxymuconolactone decarboxylase family protein [Actinomycetota bacterium]